MSNARDGREAKAPAVSYYQFIMNSNLFKPILLICTCLNLAIGTILLYENESLPSRAQCKNSRCLLNSAMYTYWYPSYIMAKIQECKCISLKAPDETIAQ